MTPPTNAQRRALLDLIAEGFQSEYNPGRMKEIGGQIRELAREMFPPEGAQNAKPGSKPAGLTCDVPGCGNKVRAKGLCMKHYQRKWDKYGRRKVEKE